MIILQQKPSFSQVINYREQTSKQFDVSSIVGDYRDVTDLSKLGLRIPSFISSDYPKFEEFIRTYYSWLSQPTQAIGFGRALLRERDAASATTLLSIYKTEYLRPFPALFAANLPLTVQHSKEIYSSKGSELGIFTFFKTLYNEEPEIVYPREKVLKASTVEWVQSTIINISNINGLTNTLEGKIIKGIVSGAYAFIETVTEITYPGTAAYFECAISDVKGTFTAGDLIQFKDNSGNLVTENIITGVSGFQIIDAGNWYIPGQSITLSNNPGVGFSGQIKEVSRGGFTDLFITNGGSGYSVGDIISTEVYLKVGIQPVPSNPNYLYDHYIGSLGTADPVATSQLDNILSKGKGLRGIVTSIDGSGTITGIRVTDEGFGFQIPPKLFVIPQHIFSGTAATININPDPLVNNQVGKIVSIQVDSFGAYYPVNNNTNYPLSDYPVSVLQDVLVSAKLNTHITDTFYSTSNILVSVIPHGIITLPPARACNIQPIFGVSTKTRGNYASDKATLSGNQKIQDGYYYQDYSYIIRSGQSLNTFRNTIRSLCHPSGMIVFGEVYVTPNLNDPNTNVSAAPYRGSFEEANAVNTSGGAKYRNIELNILTSEATDYFSKPVVNITNIKFYKSFPFKSTKNTWQTTFTGSISGNVLTVTSNSGNLTIGQTITGAGVTGGTIITGVSTGYNGTGNYFVNTIQTISSTVMTAYDASGLYNNYPNTEQGIPLDTIAKSPTKRLVEAPYAYDPIAKNPFKRLVDIGSGLDAISKAPTKIIPETPLAVETISKTLSKPFYDIYLGIDAFAKAPNKLAADTTQTAEFLVKSTNKKLVDAPYISDSVAKSITKIFLDGVVLYENLVSGSGKQTFKNDALSSADSIALNTIKRLTDYTSSAEYFKVVLRPGASALVNLSSINSSTLG